MNRRRFLLGLGAFGCLAPLVLLGQKDEVERVPNGTGGEVRDSVNQHLNEVYQRLERLERG